LRSERVDAAQPDLILNPKRSPGKHLKDTCRGYVGALDHATRARQLAKEYTP
jgi:hypothetical protein